MTIDIAPLASPIDALYLLHNALRTEAERAEQTVEHLEVGSSFKAFQPVFYHWALVLSTYVEAAERALTALVPEVARAWETTTGTAGQLLERLEALQTYIQTEIGKTMVIARTKRQLFGRVALARLLQEDLLEDEEACLLPVLRTQLGEARQLEILCLLLIDQDAEPQDTLVAWIAQDVGVAQRARQLGTADTLAAFAQALHQWASALEEHARIEDTYMTPLLPARPVVQDNEAAHQRLTTLFRELASFLQAVPPQTPLSPRMQRHVLGHVITLCIEHDDHLESEEDLVLPLVRQRLSEAQQGAIVWRLLCDGGSQKGTIRPWIMAALTTTEQQVLAACIARWEAVPDLASAPCPAALEEPPPTSLPGSAQAGAPAVRAVSQTV